MGYGLETFELWTWVMYIAVIVGFEAWFIGRWYGHSWIGSLAVSVVANSLSAFCCAGVGGGFMHQSVLGTQYRPKPFPDALLLFTIFSLVSGVAEWFVWEFLRFKLRKYQSVLWRSTLAHLLGVPIGLFIFLLPPRPYHMLEGRTWYERWLHLTRVLEKRFPLAIEDDKPLPPVRTLAELLSKLPGKTTEGDLISSTSPEFGRFSFGNEVGRPIGEFNPGLSGMKCDQFADHPTWIIRSKEKGFPRGIAFDGSNVRLTVDPNKLGYK